MYRLLLALALVSVAASRRQRTLAPEPPSSSASASSSASDSSSSSSLSTAASATSSGSGSSDASELTASTESDPSLDAAIEGTGEEVAPPVATTTPKPKFCSVDSDLSCTQCARAVLFMTGNPGTPAAELCEKLYLCSGGMPRMRGTCVEKPEETAYKTMCIAQTKAGLYNHVFTRTHKIGNVKAPDFFAMKGFCFTKGCCSNKDKANDILEAQMQQYFGSPEPDKGLPKEMQEEMKKDAAAEKQDLKEAADMAANAKAK